MYLLTITPGLFFTNSILSSFQKKHIPSLIAMEEDDTGILMELLAVIKQVASQVAAEYGACRVMTNLGAYQESKHLHWHVVYGDTVRK